MNTGLRKGPCVFGACPSHYLRVLMHASEHNLPVSISQILALVRQCSTQE